MMLEQLNIHIEKQKKTLSMMYKKTLKWSIELHIKAENYKTPTKKM